MQINIINGIGRNTILINKSRILKPTCNISNYELYKTICCCSANVLTFKNKITSKKFDSASKHIDAFGKIKHVCRRFLCSESRPPSNKLPPLMNFPQIIWPSIIKSVRNFILTTFIIKPYMDREFNVPDFIVGSKKAAEVVSTRIAEGDIKSLEGLITSEAILSIQQTVSHMSLTQREQIAVNADDIYFSFPYQVGIIFNDEEKTEQKRFVEITMVYHALRGLSIMRSRGEEPPMNMGMLPEYRTRISISNYRFIREYTKGVNSDWTINLLNHFKPSDELDE